MSEISGASSRRRVSGGGAVFALPAPPPKKKTDCSQNTLIFFKNVFIYFAVVVAALKNKTKQNKSLWGASTKIKRKKIWNQRTDSGVSPASRYPLCEHEHIMALIFYACSQSRLSRQQQLQTSYT